MIHFSCPECLAELRAPDTQRRKLYHCPHCGQVGVIAALVCDGRKRLPVSSRPRGDDSLHTIGVMFLIWLMILLAGWLIWYCYQGG